MKPVLWIRSSRILGATHIISFWALLAGMATLQCPSMQSLLTGGVRSADATVSIHEC